MDLFKNRNFVRLFFAAFASQMGTTVGNMAFAFFLLVCDGDLVLFPDLVFKKLKNASAASKHISSPYTNKTRV